VAFLLLQQAVQQVQRLDLRRPAGGGVPLRPLERPQHGRGRFRDHTGRLPSGGEVVLGFRHLTTPPTYG
jgi:hypothetical protein